jgi:hypothetical protein
LRCHSAAILDTVVSLARKIVSKHRGLNSQQLIVKGESLGPFSGLDKGNFSNRLEINVVNEYDYRKLSHKSKFYTVNLRRVYGEDGVA